MKNIEKLDERLPKFYEKIGMTIPKSTVMKSNYWMHRMEIALGTADLPMLSSLLPFTRSNHKDEVMDMRLTVSEEIPPDTAPWRYR